MKKKLIIIFTFIFFLTGCTADITIDISYMNVDGDMIINGKKYDEIFTDINNITQDFDNVSIYKKNNKVNISHNISLEQINYNDYSKYVDLFILGLDDGGIGLDISKFNIFKLYKDLEQINISITSDYVVTNSNADKIENEKYIWIVDKNNYESKKIHIETSNKKMKKVTNNNNQNTIAIFTLILVIIFVIILFIVNIIKNYSKQKNKI